MTDIDKMQKVLDHLDALHSKIDEQSESNKALAARLDSLEGASKARADAEEKERKEREEKEKADAALRRADAGSREKLDAIEKDRAGFTDAQVRADSAYQSWGKQAPHAVHGETLRDFRIRLLAPLKQHSKVYRDSALDLIGDDATFSVVENAIVNDAIEASCLAPPAGSPLREQVTRMPSGHTVTKFVGDPAVTWAPFMGGATTFGRIVVPKR